MPDRSEPTPRAVLLDALGTTVELIPPLEPLATALGIEPDARLRSALGEEMRFYRRHAGEARDAAGLDALRARCAAILTDRIGVPVDVDALMSAIRFRAYPDARPALLSLRGAGIALACVSNWDIGLPRVLGEVGLADLFDVVVSSAGIGHAKPAPEPFAAALDRLGVGPGDAVHVGDTPGEDVEGARAAGIRALLIDREGGAGELQSLAELPSLLGVAGHD